MTGRFIAVVGPSGVGKDSVMEGLAAEDPSEDGPGAHAGQRRTVTTRAVYLVDRPPEQAAGGGTALPGCRVRVLQTARWVVPAADMVHRNFDLLLGGDRDAAGASIPHSTRKVRIASTGTPSSFHTSRIWVRGLSPAPARSSLGRSAADDSRCSLARRAIGRRARRAGARARRPAQPAAARARRGFALDVPGA